MQSTSRFEEATVAAERRAIVSGAAAAAIVAFGVATIVAVALAAPWAIVVGLVLAAVVGALWVRRVRAQFAAAASRVLADVPARPLGEDDAPRWHNALSGVALLTGVNAPAVRIVDVPTANVMVVSDGRSSTVVVTAGLLDDSGPVEMEVLAAELLCRMRDGSARLTTLVIGLPGWLGTLAGLTPEKLTGLLGDQRCSRLDLEAVTVTSYPPGLISALDRMARRGTCVPGVPGSTSALWIAPVFAGAQSGYDGLCTTLHQPLDYRIAVLQEL